MTTTYSLGLTESQVADLRAVLREPADQVVSATLRVSSWRFEPEPWESDDDGESTYSARISEVILTIDEIGLKIPIPIEFARENIRWWGDEAELGQKLLDQLARYGVTAQNDDTSAADGDGDEDVLHEHFTLSLKPPFTLAHTFPVGALDYIDKGRTGILDLAFDQMTYKARLRDHTRTVDSIPSVRSARSALAWATGLVTASGYRVLRTSPYGENCWELRIEPAD